MANTKITNPELFNLGDSTSATQLPVMTTTQRIAMNAPPSLTVDYLVVAGGGGGARSAFTSGGASGGGGGAGEYLYKTAQTLTAGGSGYTVTVGDGGSAGASGVSATNGGNSVFIDTTLGGGYGGTGNNSTYSPGASGGSGGGSGINGSTVYAGGSSTATSPGLGNAGGASTSASSAYGAGGGGGAGTAGSNGTSSTGGNGGTGVQNSITSTATFYAGGGGGGSFNNNNVGSGGSGVGGNANARAAGSPGTSNTGSGGGGGSYSGSAHTNGASGGSGIVILKYATSDIASYTATGLTPTETIVGTDTILSFTTVGTGTITFTSSTPTGTISTGEMIFNSTTDKVEYWDGTKWYGITYESQAESPYNSVLYTGNGNTSNPQTNIGFNPDLVWIADTDAGNYNPIQDSVRGVDSVLVTALNSGELSSAWRNSYGQITSFDSDGFNVSDGSGNTNSNFNQSGRDYVAWCFKAGGAAVANTNGNIASQVSANVAGGFSVVKWSGNDTTGGTIGHGLSSTPELTIIKKTSANANWQVSLNASVTGQEGYMNLDATAGLYTTYPLYYTSSNSTVLSSNGTSTTTRLYNNQSADYIAYCFHSVAGVSKVGSFLGTGVAGKKITLDFQPAWLMIKRSSTTGDWTVIDNKINTASIKRNYIKINEIGAENTATTGIVFESDGFSFSGGSFNQSGQTAIYLAFA